MSLLTELRGIRVALQGIEAQLKKVVDAITEPPIVVLWQYAPAVGVRCYPGCDYPRRPEVIQR